MGEVHCSWCHKFMYLKGNLPDKTVSHGICTACERALLDNIMKQHGGQHATPKR